MVLRRALAFDVKCWKSKGRFFVDWDHMIWTTSNMQQTKDILTTYSKLTHKVKIQNVTRLSHTVGEKGQFDRIFNLKCGVNGTMGC